VNVPCIFHTGKPPIFCNDDESNETDDEGSEKLWQQYVGKAVELGFDSSKFIKMQWTV
jgi:hypothetical protein